MFREVKLLAFNLSAGVEWSCNPTRGGTTPDPRLPPLSSPTPKKLRLTTAQV